MQLDTNTRLTPAQTITLFTGVCNFDILLADVVTSPRFLILGIFLHRRID